MHREGHIGAALVGYAPLGFVALVAGYDAVAVGGAVAAVGLAMLPDVDMKLPLVSHRGPTHTVWFALVVGGAGLVGGAVVGLETGPIAAVGLAVFGFLVGTTTIVAHLAADALTPMGVRPLAPVDDREYCFEVARAANPLANYGLLALGGGVAAGALALASVVAG